MAELSATYPNQNTVVERGRFSARETYDTGLLRLQIYRHRSDAEAESALGITLPKPGGVSVSNDLLVCWAAPGEWILCVPRDAEMTVLADLSAKLDRRLGVLTLMTDSRGAIALRGEASADMLARGSLVDFHPRAFPAGRCLTTLFAKTPAMVVHQDSGQYLVFVCRSVVAYLLDWLAANSTDL